MTKRSGAKVLPQHIGIEAQMKIQLNKEPRALMKDLGNKFGTDLITVMERNAGVMNEAGLEGYEVVSVLMSGLCQAMLIIEKQSTQPGLAKGMMDAAVKMPQYR